ncbi:MAG: hypothetical protein HAW60_00420 [Bdellovibrionales bacterium]|nr:hypothetical protein [Bdellovibrionales bacterium]
METSSRVTKSLFYFLEQKQISLLPKDIEINKNLPLSWINTKNTSLYIKQAEKEYLKVFPNSFFYQDWAEASFSLRAWDGLGSVLRIMPMPDPERLAYFLAQFFSYFISPQIEVKSLSLGEKSEFKTFISEKSFPEIAKYLSACITYIPCFNKNSNVSCTWEGDILRVNFFNQQPSIFDNQISKTHITPELMNSLLEDFKKKEELLIIREKDLLKQEKNLKKQEKLLQNNLLSSFSKLFNLSKNVKTNSKKIINTKNSIEQFSFDLD